MLEKSTHFGTGELESLYGVWLKHSVDGRLTREQFAEGMKEIGITDPLLLEQNFSAYNPVNNTIAFQDFICGLSIILRGTPDERIHFLFRAYTDGAYVDPVNMERIFKAALSSKGRSVVQDDLVRVIKEIFKAMDADNDGRLTFSEFKSAIEKSNLLSEVFN